MNTLKRVPTWTWITAAVVVLALVGVSISVGVTQSQTHATAAGSRMPSAKPSATHSVKPSARPAAFSPAVPTDSYSAPSASSLAALPEASYKAVIAGLIGYEVASAPTSAGSVYALVGDTAIYGAGAIGAVGRLPQKNFLGTATIVVPVHTSGEWTLILTPSRSTLPSAAGGLAPAQTAAWIRTAALADATPLNQTILVSVAAQTLSVVNRDGSVAAAFSVAVGAPATPTPTGVTGYLQARYLDPAQNESVHPIQLTSLHSAAADEPFGGHDGGLIGLHYFAANAGAISHGCVRLTTAAVDAVNALPLGTLVTLAP